MELAVFKEKLVKLATNKDIPVVEIEAFLAGFYRSKPLPVLQNAQYQHFVRSGINEPGEVFKNVSRCSYNPFVEKIGLMRCNYPHQQVLYTAAPTKSENATASSTALMETALEHVKNHDIRRHYFTLSKWNTSRPLHLFCFPFSKKSIERNFDFSEANANFDKELNRAFSADYKEAILYFRESLEFISDIFCEMENKELYYRISAAFYNCIMNFASNKKIDIDGILYPSANTLAGGINAVLKKELVDDKTLQCTYVHMYAMQRNPSNPKDINFETASNGVVPDAGGNFSFSYIC